LRQLLYRLDEQNQERFFFTGTNEFSLALIIGIDYQNNLNDSPKSHCQVLNLPIISDSAINRTRLKAFIKDFKR